MAEYQFILPIAIALSLGAMSPGPSFLMVAKTAVERSRAEGLAVAGGLAVGAVILALLSMLGLHVVLHTIPSLYVGLKLLGGAYLCYLAYRFWRSASQTTTDQVVLPQAHRAGWWRAFLIGLATQLSNPKTAIVLAGIFAAFLPQPTPPYAFILIAVVTFVLDLSWYSFVVLALSTRQARAVYLRFKRPIGRMASGFMGVIGVKLAFVS